MVDEYNKPIGHEMESVNGEVQALRTPGISVLQSRLVFAIKLCFSFIQKALKLLHEKVFILKTIKKLVFFLFNIYICVCVV